MKLLNTLAALWQEILERSSQRRLEKAQAQFETMLEIDSKSPRLWMRHAEICKRLKREGLAALSYRTAGLLLRDQYRFAQATAAFRLASKLNPNDRIVQKELRRAESRIIKGISEMPSRRVTEIFYLCDLDVATQIVEVELQVEEPATSPSLAVFEMKPAEA
jgi:tetratricopeptide (TPR) repeat protein